MTKAADKETLPFIHCEHANEEPLPIEWAEDVKRRCVDTSYVTEFRWWDRALSDDEVAALARGEEVPPDEPSLPPSPVRWGLKCSTADGEICLMQIAGGGRLRLLCEGRAYWSQRPRGVVWEAYPTTQGETFATKEAAEKVIANLS